MPVEPVAAEPARRETLFPGGHGAPSGFCAFRAHIELRETPWIGAGYYRPVLQQMRLVLGKTLPAECRRLGRATDPLGAAPSGFCAPWPGVSLRVLLELACCLLLLHTRGDQHQAAALVHGLAGGAWEEILRRLARLSREELEAEVALCLLKL